MKIQIRFFFFFFWFRKNFRSVFNENTDLFLFKKIFRFVFSCFEKKKSFLQLTVDFEI